MPGNGAVGISFKRVAKNALISLNGRLAMKLGPGQPQKMDVFSTEALPACSVRLYKVWRRWAGCGRICDATLLKEIPAALLSKIIFFQFAKMLRFRLEETGIASIYGLKRDKGYQHV